MSAKNKSLNLEKDILYDLYVVQQLSTLKISSLFDCTPATIRKYLKVHSIPIRSFSETTSIQSKQMSEKQKLVRAKKFRETWNSRPLEERLQINKTRATKPENVDAQVRKIKESKAKNNSGKKSKAEDRFYELLKITFDENDILRQYYCDEYPYNCDFYIKSKNMFIEYQGHPTHGPHPFGFDKNDNELLLELSKHLDMKTWTVRDVNKIKTAMDNNIKLILVYDTTIYVVEHSDIKSLQLNELWEM